MKKAFEFVAQVGGAINNISDAINSIYGAIEGLEALKEEHKEKLGVELNISVELKGIKENLEALTRLAERYSK